MNRSGAWILALAAGALLTAVLFFALPAAIYAGNVGEFEWSMASITKEYVPYLIVLPLVCVAPSLALPRRYALWWSAACASVAVYAWVYGNFVVYKLGLIDGRTWSLDAPVWKLIGELLAVGVFLALIFKISKTKPAVVAGLMLLLAGGSLYSAWPALSQNQPETPRLDVSAVYSFSKEKNVLVVLLDAMQSDVFEEVVSETPRLAETFKGFTFYPDTSGVAPTTYLSLPAIHSGLEYDRKTTLLGYYKTAIAQGSFLNKLKEAGYESSMVNAIMRVCPEKADICASDRSIMGGPTGSRRPEAANLIDLSLLRISPLALKPLIYNGGRWLIGPLVQDPRFIQHSVRGNSMMLDMAEHLNASSTHPTAKFLHLLSTHTPVVMNERCEFVGETIPTTRTSFKTHVRCGLEAFATMIDALKRNGLYDNTAIALLSDHGVQVGSSRVTSSKAGVSPQLVGSANPTFAFKPIGAAGDMRRSDRPISIADVSAIICESVGDCSVNRTVGSGERVFNFYNWSNDFWRADRLPSIVVYTVGKPLWNTALWKRQGDPVALNKQISFAKSGGLGRYRLAGWAAGESWGSWTLGKSAEILFDLPPSVRDLKLEVDTQGFLGPKKIQVAHIRANDVPIGILEYGPDSMEVKKVFSIPAEALRENGDDLTISFQVDYPTSPKELNGSDDMRQLGIGVRSMTLLSETH